MNSLAAIVGIVIMVLQWLIWIIIIQAILSWLVAFNVINTHNSFVRTVLVTLDRMLDPLLRPIRRVFHTLKGSGRLVGARRLGEFSWAIESMLNRVLDGTRPASPAVVAMVDQAFYTLPELQAVLRGESKLRVSRGAIGGVAPVKGAKDVKEEKK